MEKEAIINILSDKKVLYAEDEAGIRRNISEILELFFMDVKAVDNGQAVLDEMSLNHYDALILDISMPQLDGLEAAKSIRKTNREIPIIIVSAHSSQEYLWRAVELKITKYLVKPHTKDELVDALEEMASEFIYHTRKPIRLDETTFYSPCKKTIQTNGALIRLSLMESRLLEYFTRHKNCTVSFEDVYDYLWGYEPPSKEALKSVIKNLRKKINKDMVQNVYGIGYIFVLDESKRI